MTDILWNVIEIAVALFESAIVLYFICGFLMHDFKTLKGKIVYISGSVVGAILKIALSSVTLYDWWLSAAYIAYWFVFALLFLNGKILDKLLTAILSDVIVVSTGNFVSGLCFIILKISFSEVYSQHGVYKLIRDIIYLLLILLFMRLILKISDKTIIFLKRREWALIISVFLISVLSLAMIQVALNENVLSDSTTIMMMLSEVGLFALNLMSLYITFSLSKSNREAEEFKLKEQQLMHNIQYAETVRGQYEEIRNIRHDMKQHLAVVSGLQTEGKIEAAQKYISDISSEIDKIEMFMDVGNDFVNAILNSKLSIAKSKGIEVLCGSSSNVSGVGEYDLCNLLGNMLDNAIEAAEKTGENAVVEVAIISDKHKLMITVSNSTPQSVLNGNSELKTTKSKSNLHGFGIKTIRSIAEKYDGSVDFYEENMMFICRVILGKM